MKDYDVIIIGSGIGGLTSALLFAKEGKKIAVFEKEAYAGGLCSSFERQDFLFDIAVDSIGGLKQGQFLREIFKQLGIEKKLKFQELNPMRRNIFPDCVIDLIPGVDEYKKTLIKLFPKEKRGLDDLFGKMIQIYENSLDRPSFIYSYIGKNFQEFLEEYIDDLKLRGILSTYSTFLGLPTSEVSLIAYVNLFMHYLAGGAFRFKGGMRSLIDVLEKEIKKYSGDIFLNKKVDKIITEGRQAKGISTDDKEIYFANNIVCDIDLKTVLNKMIPINAVDKDKFDFINKEEVSNSFVIAYLGLDIDYKKFNCPLSIGYFSSYDCEAMLNDDYTDIAFGLSFANDNTAVIHIPLKSYDKIDKEKIIDIAIKKIDSIIPDFSRHIILKSISGPDDIYKYTGNTNGSAYGWIQKAGFYGKMSLCKNILNNFDVVGHWAGLGGGVMPCMISGMDVFGKALK